MKAHAGRTLVVAPVLFFLATAFPLLADTRIEKNLKLDPGGKLVLDADAGSVEVTGGAGAGAHILITSTYDDIEEKFNFTFEETPGTVRVIARKKGGEGLLSWLGGSTHAPSFQIQVPSRTELQVKTGGGHLKVTALRGDVDLHTSGGHIEISDLQGKVLAKTSGGHISLKDVVGDTTISTSGGHIEVASLRGSLNSETSGGHIDLKDVTGDIETETSGGHISIAGAGGRVHAETSGGSVEVGFVKGNGRGGIIESSGGSISVSVDPALGYQLDAESSGGGVSSDLPLSSEGARSRSSLRGTIGKGGETLRLRTSAGSIRIRPIGGA